MLTQGWGPASFLFHMICGVMLVNAKRLEILRVLSTELLLDMIDNIHDLSEESQKIALEEIVYILFEREVKANE